MAEKKIVVPEGMLRAVEDTIMSDSRPGFCNMDLSIPSERHEFISVFLESALLWLVENPILPTSKDLVNFKQVSTFHLFDELEKFRWIIAEWQRRSFLEPEPESPKEVNDLLEPNDAPTTGLHRDAINERIIEAFRRGKKVSR